MARTLILNISASAQTLPAAYGGYVVVSGHGRVVADESSVVVSEMGGFAAMDGKWVVSAISTDTALGDIDVAAGGVALLASFVGGGGGGGGGGPVAWADILNKPAFANVATSGAYADLSGKPVLADVATSGSYADLSGTPTLPTASNASPVGVGTTAAAGVQSAYARGDHQHAHGNLAGGTLHSAASTASAGFMSAADKTKLDGLATVATSGSYNDLADKPAFGMAALSNSFTDLDNTPTLAAVATSGAYADLSGKPSLATVATSGAYADLSGAPSLATVATSGAYADLSGKPTLFSGAYADLTGKPSLFSGAYADLSGKPTLAAVATSGSASDLADQPYDIIANAAGTLTVGQVVLKAFAPRALSLIALTQASSTTAVVEIRVNGVAASYPQAVSTGQLITAVVTTAGIDCWFSVTGKVV